MRSYQVVVLPDVRLQLKRHAAFIANVSKPAAVRFRNEFADIIARISDNPFQFPPNDAKITLPTIYRKALFAKWYKVLFYIEGNTVYVDAVVDGRSNLTYT